MGPWTYTHILICLVVAKLARFEFIIASLCVLYVPITLWVHESPQFLHSNQKTEEAEKVLEHFSQVTGGSYSREKVDISTEKCEDEHESESFWKMCHSFYFVRTLITVFLVFLTTCIVYYGLGFSAGDLPGSVYVNTSMSGLVEIGANILAMTIMGKVGRKPILIVTMVSNAIICAAAGTMFLFGGETLDEIGRWLSFVGKFTVSVQLSVATVYAIEVYPTPVRSISSALGFVGEDIGSFIAPYVVAISTLWIPFVIYCACGMLGAIAAVMFAETRNKHIPNTLADMKKNGRKLTEKITSKL